MTNFEITAIQLAIASARDIMFEMFAQTNEVHKKPVPSIYRELWNDLDDMIIILNEQKKEEE